MKKKLLFIFFLVFNFLNSQETHIDFDTYNPEVTFESWNNSSTFDLTINPSIPLGGGTSEDPVNESIYVGQFTAGADDGGNFDSNIGIGVVNPTTVFTSPFDLGELNYFTMKVYALEEVTLTFHIENSPDWGNFEEATATIGPNQINQWVELYFDFNNVSNIFMNNIVIKVDGPDWVSGDFLFFDDIVGPPLYSSPAFEYSPADLSTDVSVGVVMEIVTNNKFYDPGAVTITDFTNKVALRLGDENGADVAFQASIVDDSRITISPDSDLDYLTTYWYGVIDNTIYSSNGTYITGVGATFTTKEPVTGDINVMLIDYETPETSIAFESWGSAGFAQTPNPAPDAVNPSSQVGQFTHPGGEWSSTIETSPTLDNIDFAETPYWNVKVWADKPIDIVFKLQNNVTYWINNEFTYSLSNEEIDQWVQLSFNFSNVTATNYNRIQMWFDGNTSGGSVAGDVYYFDDIEKSSVPPPALVIFSPGDEATGVLQYSQLSIESNFQFVNIDGSDIENPISVLELRENNSAGAEVSFYAALSTNKTKFTIVPVEPLSSGATYWYGVKDGMIKYDENQSTVSGVNATFSVTNDVMPEMVVYNDFDGNSLCSLTEALNDPESGIAPSFDLFAQDPMNPSNSVMEWTKGTTWYGWERINIQLNAPFDASLGDLFSFRVFSPVKTGIRFKLTDASYDWEQTGNYETGSESFPDPSIVVENQWQTFYFNISDLADGVSFDHLQIFIGRGDMDADVSNTTFYIDDIMGPALQNTNSNNDFETANVVIYPNPANDIVQIENLIGNKTIKILDINGRLVTQTTTDSNMFSVAFLNKGFYFVEINGHIKKLIKN